MASRHDAVGRPWSGHPAGWKKPLPAKLVAGVWVLALGGMRKEDTAEPALEIVGGQAPDGIDLSLEHVAGPLGQDPGGVERPTRFRFG